MTVQWWKDGVIYQVYPASYQDSNGDGVGDIPGIISRLDYIKSLGVDIIWLSPHYKSPQLDMGYDISDYNDIHEPYGTLADCERLIRETHKRDMRIIFDLVVNHTSDQHRWFQESRSSRDNPKRNWYIWRPARYDADGTRREPSNWSSCFGGSAWQWDEQTQEYYLHLFVEEQPDLNWRNPEVREAIKRDAMRFWLDRGVDGFRIDTVNMYSKPEEFHDVEVVVKDTPYQDASHVYHNGPEIHNYLREINEVLSEYDAMTVGELGCTPDPARVLRYVGAARQQLNMVFQFDLCGIDSGPSNFERHLPREYSLDHFKELVERWQKFIEGNDGWTTSFLENHDRPRAVSHYADDSPEFRVPSAKMLATLLLTLTGTPYIYQGEEIGMINVPHDWPIEEYKDVDSNNFYRDHHDVSGGDQVTMRRVMAGIRKLARDNARTPFQWDASTHAGFVRGGSALPWMRVHDEYPAINAEAQQADKTSVLNYYRALLAFRKAHKGALVHGTFDVLDRDNQHVFTYVKRGARETAVVVLNFSKREQDMPALEAAGENKLALSSLPTPSTSGRLQPFEARVYIK